MREMRNIAYGLAVALFCSGWARAEILRFDSAETWRTWQMPQGIVNVNENGGLQLKRFRKNINAVTDALLFTHATQKRGEVQGGIWWVGSGQNSAEFTIDGDQQTFWQPDAADPLPRWTLDIDLGRPVLARNIRLIFPDQEGARPLRQFSVYTSTGARIRAADDVFKYEVAYRTTRPNTESVVEFFVAGLRDTARAIDPDLSVDLEAENRFRAIQFLRIKADEKNPDAALAEIEVLAQGDNLSLGTLARGGSFKNGVVARQPQNMFDGDMNTSGSFLGPETNQGDWQQVGLWWQADLGATFWVDEIFIYWQNRGEGLSGFLLNFLHAGSGYEIFSSDGRRTLAGDIDFAPLILEPDPQRQSEFDQGPLHYRYLFRARKIRHLFWRAINTANWFSRPMEFMMFSPGFPAEVVLHSELIDLGKASGDGRARAVRNLSWDADLPQGSQLKLRSRSGNTLRETFTFYDKKGDAVEEDKWNSLPNVLKGPVDTALVVSDDWGTWSNFYQRSGEAFKSESPRRFLQLEMTLATDDPQAAAAVRSLSIEFEEALLQDARGRVLPRQAKPNEDTRFTYSVWPTADAIDSGFDLLRLSVPGQVSREGLVLRIGEANAIPVAVSTSGDSLLLIELPQRITSDSIAIEFTARLLRNASVFSLDLGTSDRPGIWQSVETSARASNVVYLPELANSATLIADLKIAPPIFSPNGDGINDRVQIRFAIFKVEAAEPQVRIFDLTGRLIAELQPQPNRSTRSYTWSGTNLAGDRVAPGIYLCHIDVGAQAGDDIALKPIAVVY